MCIVLKKTPGTALKQCLIYTDACFILKYIINHYANMTLTRLCVSIEYVIQSPRVDVI